MNKRNSVNKLRDKFPSRPCGAEDSMYLTNEGVDLLRQLFCMNPLERISAREALKHAWFNEEPRMAA
jgi:serine/threonine protein kinase